ncbi:hypothetical protein ACFLTQ_01200 [Chloroflexota bacterium]
MAPLQKRALYSLLIGLILSITLAIVFIIKGVDNFDEDLSFRIIVYVMWVGVPLVHLILVDASLRKPEQIDERDRLIKERAPRIQWMAVVFSLAAWVIVLTEHYGDQGQVPLAFLTLIMISTLIVSILSLSIGILIGYWRG